MVSGDVLLKLGWRKSTLYRTLMLILALRLRSVERRISTSTWWHTFYFRLPYGESDPFEETELGAWADVATATIERRSQRRRRTSVVAAGSPDQRDTHSLKWPVKNAHVKAVISAAQD